MRARSDRFATAPKAPVAPVAFTPPPPPPSRPLWQRLALVACSAVVFGGALVAVRVLAAPETDAVYAAAQVELASRFEAAAASPTTVPAPPALVPESVVLPDEPPPAATPVPRSLPASLTPVVRLAAPSIGLDELVVPGVDQFALSFGPGWMTHTAFPGQPGNAVVSGHSSTYGGPFNRIPELQVGDTISVQTPDGTVSVFEVRAGFVVDPGGVFVTDPTPGVRLTLTTCFPLGSDAQRYIIQAELVDGPALLNAVPFDAWAPSQQ